MKNIFYDYEKEQHHFSTKRLSVLFFIAALLFFILVTRLFFITNISEIREKREKRFLRQGTVTSWRSDILDSRGQPLALSYYVYDIGMHPTKLSNLSELDKSKVKQILAIDSVSLKNFIKKKQFSYLVKSKVLTSEELKVLRSIPNMTLDKHIKRYYPLGEITAPLLGFVNHQGEGIEGLEGVFNRYLKRNNDSGEYWSSPAGDKKFISTSPVSQDNSLKLSIDNRIQTLLFRELEKTYKQFNMHAISAVIMSPKDFSLKAVASYPSYDPHHRPSYSDIYRLKPAGDIFEPGSVIKPLTLACLLDKEPSIASLEVQTEPGFFYVDNNKIRDIRNYGALSLEDILKVSSNVGIAKLVLEYSNGDLFNFWQSLSLMQGSQVEFRPETAGDLTSYIPQGSFSEAILGFGYGLKMNLIQLAQLYGIIAGDGSYRPVTLLADPHADREGVKVVSERTKNLLRQYLKAPVEHGTARRAFLSDLAIAGKTGTARRTNESGEYEKIYNSFFVGFFPAEEPEYVIAIYADDPKEQYYGGIVCAPIVKNIAHQLMQLP